MNDIEKKLAAEARNAYARKWRAANPDKVKKNNANYWLRRAKKIAQNTTDHTKGDENDV